MHTHSPPSARMAVQAATPFSRMLDFWLRTYVFLTLLCLPVANAVFVNFESCLASNRNPNLLQFTPFFVDATFDETLPTHALNFTIYGNVSGQYFAQALPPPDDPYWTNPNETAGKIVDIGSGNRYTTLSARYDVVTYTAADNPGQQFCQSLLNSTGDYIGHDCPLAPVFNYTRATVAPTNLPAVFLSQDMNGTYAFSTISSTIQLLSGDADVIYYMCITTNITPALGHAISSLITWLPAAILTIKGLATLAAAIYSPWGSADIFRWSSNYGRDEDLLRLVTPGFGDCLQYIQFVVLTGALTLQYPGFYQPAVRQAAWSTLLFNESYVSGGPGTQSLVDGIYRANGTYGMAEMSQYIGMTTPNDIWACMAIWLLVIAGSVVVLCQLGFFARYCYRKVTSTSEEDLRKKNLPFTLGNMIRLLFNFFILPIVALSLFQLVISQDSAPSSVIACAAILLGIMIVSAGWILRVIFTTKPRTSLFDDMPTVLLYGPLYNTYSDSAAPFALIPVFITFMRGVALGAIQPSGIAQIILLAICEVILILTLNGFRPFQGQTSMNLYHTVFATVRLATVLLMIAFVPSLGVSEAPKGWIGYTILVMHACVLVFGFFLNSAQTLVEVLARALGAGGGDNANDAIRGSILNWRMLKKRQTRGTAGQGDRASTMSTAAMLGRTSTGGHPAVGGRSRSISASSQQLLGGRTSGFDNLSTTTGLDPLGSPDPEGEHAMAFGYGRTSKDHGGESGYYRAPRPRKATMDTMTAASAGRITPGGKTRSASQGGADFFPYRDAPTHSREASYDPDHMPAAAYFRERQLSDGGNTVVGGARTDYAVREVDQYYRGQALNDQPTRKLKTGPADPEGPAIAAQSWFTKLLFGVQGGKKKDAGKGFEVVRSSRMPPEMQAAANRAAAAEDVEMQETTPPLKEHYFDDPTDSTQELSTDEARPATMVPADEVEGEGAEHRDLLSPSSPEANRNTRVQSFDFGFDGADDRPITTYGATDTFRPDSETVAHPAIFNPIDRQSAATAATATTGATLSGPFDAGLRRQSRETDISNYDAQSSLYGEDHVEEHAAVARRVTMRPSLDPVALVGGRDLAAHPLSLSTGGSPTGGGLRPSPTTSGHQDNRLSAAPSSIAPSDIGKSSSGQDWLRAVDALGWNHNEARASTSTLVPTSEQHAAQQRASASPTSPYQTSAFPLPPQQQQPPAVPEKNSRRGTVTSDSVPAEYLAYINSPTSRPTSPEYRVVSPMSQHSDHRGFGHRHQPSESSFTSSVNHHRAADSITRNSFGANVAMQASRAEYFGRDRSPTPSEAEALGRHEEDGGFI